MVIVTLYRLPLGDVNILFDNLSNILNICYENGRQASVCGDFNFNFNFTGSTNVMYCRDIMSSFGLRDMVSKILG